MEFEVNVLNKYKVTTIKHTDNKCNLDFTSQNSFQSKAVY